MKKLAKKTKVSSLKKGTLLISKPFITNNEQIKRSTILIVEHNEGISSVGFILNKETDLPVFECLDDFPFIENNLFFGGANQTDLIHFLHKSPDIVDSIEISPGIYWGGSVDQMKIYIESGKIEEKDIRFFAGYTIWENNQLKEELLENKWILSNGKKNLIFNDEPEKTWGQALEDIGSNLAVFANFPEEPSLN